jgi:hypothetical protein
VAGGW